jgi:predicted RNA methylase
VIAGGEIAALLLLAVAAVVYFVFASFLAGAGYQPAFPAVVTSMLDLAEVGPSDVVYDPGAGTGAILFRAARERGARTVGIEIEPVRVALLRLRRYLQGPRDRVEVRWMNLFEADYRPATVVAVFLWPEAMRRLQPILEAQLAPGSRVVSHWHEIPGWTPVRVDPRHRVYLYRWEGRRPSAVV